MKTVSITVGVGDTWVGKWRLAVALLLREGTLLRHRYKRTDASGDSYDRKFLDDNFLTMLPGKIVITRQRRR